MSTAARSVPIPPGLLAVAARVEERLVEMFDVEIARWRELDADVEAPLRSLERLTLAGGKRLRPAFCHWGYIAAGGEPGAPAVTEVGCALELLQAFALVHDDVMDGSAVRRGARTAHLAFGDEHRERGWRGDDRRFGEGVAILIGDLAHVYADRFLHGVSPDARQVWDELRLELNVGQYLDILGTARADADLLRARRIARYKSGKYTIERPLHLGAALAGRLAELAGELSAYGDPLGEAFQLRDDLLGAFGDESATGKPVGDDLREGKPTPLLAIALDRADAVQARLLARVGDRELADDVVAELQDVLRATGAVAAIEATIDDLTESAITAIKTGAVDGEARDALIDLAHYVAWRDH